MDIWIQGVKNENIKCDICDKPIKSKKYLEGMQMYCSEKCLRIGVDDEQI